MARVYLCEDDESFRLLTRLHLEALGHEVVGESGDGARCVEGLASTQADVALLDGILNAEQWAAVRERSPDTRLVLYSGMPDDRLASEAARLGADDAMRKGAGSGALGGLIERLTS